MAGFTFVELLVCLGGTEKVWLRMAVLDDFSFGSLRS